MDGLEWREVGGTQQAFYEGKKVAWAPQEGAQELFMECPVFEVLLEGDRGGGKTDALLMDFAQYCGRGFGQEWKGVLFRQTYKMLADVIAKSQKWFPKLVNKPKWNASDHSWTWPTGEKLMFRYMERPSDYTNYHGHEYPWIAFEELTTWPDDKCYKVMMSCCRSPRYGMPRHYRATTNPYGVGHNWVKARFQLPVVNGTVGRHIKDEATGLDRIAINATRAQNLVLMKADPDYEAKIAEAARNPAERAAWLKGDWNIVAGGMFDDLWDPRIHVIPNISFAAVNSLGWRVNRSYDHGQSKPFSVGWWMQSNGEPIRVQGRLIGQVPGDIIRLGEWYGWNGTANEGVRMSARDIADGIIDRERTWGISVNTGPADSSIFHDNDQPGTTVAGDMSARGITWTEADKGPGSRERGWEQIRNYLRGAKPDPNGYREEPGLFICERCDNFIRTLPCLPRDDRKIDDVDTDSEDHIGDETRYRLTEKIVASDSWSWQ